MDIQHKRDCVGAITLGKDMVAGFGLRLFRWSGLVPDWIFFPIGMGGLLRLLAMSRCSLIPMVAAFGQLGLHFRSVGEDGLGLEASAVGTTEPVTPDVTRVLRHKRIRLPLSVSCQMLVERELYKQACESNH